MICLQFCELAINAAADLPPPIRADLYDYAGLCLDRDAVRLHENPALAAHLKEACKTAHAAAKALRECEASQLSFKHLIFNPPTA